MYRLYPGWIDDGQHSHIHRYFVDITTVQQSYKCNAFSSFFEILQVIFILMIVNDAQKWCGNRNKS